MKRTTIERASQRTVRGWLGALALTAAFGAAAEPVPPPAPVGPVPSERQWAWHQLEYYGFLHFGLNTFTGQDWGFGDESPAVFHPTAFDANQIVGTAREAGMKGVILVAKHLDGFCLWPTATTGRSVKSSPWREGKGDVVKDISEACRRQGLKFGIYLSSWDRSHPEYGKPGYLTCYREQLRELLTDYGEIFVAWFDGAAGGEGYYGAGRETRNVDGPTYQRWSEVWALVRQLQPQGVIFSDAGPDVRWIGNESGRGSEPCWYAMNREGRFPGSAGWEGNGTGLRQGKDWVPPECDVSIRPGWFYRDQDDRLVKPAGLLLNIYYRTVGLGAALNLNMPPDRRGLIHENDVREVREFGRLLQETFATNLTAGAKASASNVRGNSPVFAGGNIVDERPETYWATDDGVTTGEVVLEFPEVVDFSVIRLREYLPLGQRVESFGVDAWREGKWEELGAGQTIGAHRLLRLAPQRSSKLRLRVTRTTGGPAISEFHVFLEPETSPSRPKH